MARNEEKARAMLNRWYKMKRMLHVDQEERPPKITRKINSIADCEKYRHMVVTEINLKVTDIQNAGLGEHKIRELNDEINRLIKDKNRWEQRIRELGGADYRQQSTRIYDSQGIELPGSGGYKYFGAAKDLPGVRDLFQTDVPELPKKAVAEMNKVTDHEYFGIGEDELLLEEEGRLEKEAEAEMLRQWMENNKELILKRFQGQPMTQESLIALLSEDKEEQALRLEQESYEKEQQLAIQQREILESRKTELLRAFVEEEEVTENDESQLKKLIQMNESET